MVLGLFLIVVGIIIGVFGFRTAYASLDEDDATSQTEENAVKSRTRGLAAAALGGLVALIGFIIFGFNAFNAIRHAIP